LRARRDGTEVLMEAECFALRRTTSNKWCTECPA